MYKPGKVSAALLAGGLVVGVATITVGSFMWWRGESVAPAATPTSSATSTAVSPGGEPVRYYAWTDPNSQRSYVTAVGVGSLEPPVYALKNVRLREVATGASSAANRKTYEVMRVSEHSLGKAQLAPKDQLCVHLIGEMHLGKSQIPVARTSAALFSKFEIDAVMLEQPDDVAFDWNDFSFVKDRQSAIAEMQFAAFELAADADAANDLPDYAKDKRFQGKTFVDVRQMIAQEKGETEADRVVSAMKKATVADQLYKKNAYISAADYLYVMLRLNGLNVPFYGVESAHLRAQFLEKIEAGDTVMDTTARDEYMATKTMALAQTHGLHRVLLICGAAHIPTLQRELERRGAEVSVDYRAPMPNVIKNVMAIAKNPAFVREIMLSSPSPAFVVDRTAIVEAGPSGQVQEFVQSTLSAGGKGTSRLMDAYTERGMRGRTDWRVEAAVDDLKTLVLTRRGEEIELSEEVLQPTTLDAAWEDVAAGRIILDQESNARAARINATPDLLLVTVEDKGDQYVAYAGLGDPLYAGNDYGALMASVRRQMNGRQSVYFDMKNFSAEKIEAFASNCRRNAPADLSVQFLERSDGETGAQDALFAPGIRVERTETRSIEQVTEGPRKGWFRVVVDFFVRHAGTVRKVTVEFYARAATTLEEIQTRLATLVGTQNGSSSLAEMSVAQVVSVMRRDLKNRDIYVAATVHAEAKHTLVVTNERPRRERAA